VLAVHGGGENVAGLIQVGRDRAVEAAFGGVLADEFQRGCRQVWCRRVILNAG
jgi:hypothetical protein